MSINCIEHFSNELFYEIFEYLDYSEIFKLFLNLNSRFKRLILDNSSLLLKVNLRRSTTSDIKDSCQNLIIPNRHRILSLYLENESLINQFLTYCIIDSSFTRLQSIVLRKMKISESILSLFHLKSLPHLHSLTMSLNVTDDYDLTNIYRMILNFPSLKYNQLSILSDPEDEHENIFVPLAFNERFSTIECLNLNHPCTLNEVLSLLNHTPRLSRLICRNVVESRRKMENIKAIMLYKLTYIHLDMDEVWFDDFEIFMSNLFAPVQVLRIKFHTGSDYLDANGWEQLIRTRMPHLHTFNYEYHEGDATYDENDRFHTKIDGFTSSFWVKHQWFFEFGLYLDDQEGLQCSINPYRYI